MLLRFSKKTVTATQGLIVLLMAATYSYAQEVETTAVDCTQFNLESSPDGVLTKEEMIAEMERQLFASVDRYSSCMEKVQSTAAENAGAGGGANGGSGADGSGDNNENGSEQGGEQAGQEGGQEAGQENQQDSEASMADSSEQSGAAEGAAKTGKISGHGGAKSQTVTAKDNDSVVCNILAEEIQNEKDAKGKADLSAQYQKYGCK